MDLKTNIPTVNPMVVFREEFDDWAVLFDPDANETFGLDPVSAFIWKKMDGENSLDKILNELKEACEDGIPDDAPEHIEEFVTDLKNRGLIGYEEKK